MSLSFGLPRDSRSPSAALRFTTVRSVVTVMMCVMIQQGHVDAKLLKVKTKLKSSTTSETLRTLVNAASDGAQFVGWNYWTNKKVPLGCACLYGTLQYGCGVPAWPACLAAGVSATGAKMATEHCIRPGSEVRCTFVNSKQRGQHLSVRAENEDDRRSGSLRVGSSTGVSAEMGWDATGKFFAGVTPLTGGEPGYAPEQQDMGGAGEQEQSRRSRSPPGVDLQFRPGAKKPRSGSPSPRIHSSAEYSSSGNHEDDGPKIEEVPDSDEELPRSTDHQGYQEQPGVAGSYPVTTEHPAYLNANGVPTGQPYPDKETGSPGSSNADIFGGAGGFLGRVGGAATAAASAPVDPAGWPHDAEAAAGAGMSVDA
ncbi:unnamed protein product [Amoebophrya sp. A120]|nr:unnamed protein product [Amoebophrya sp. A120]|eukprot:GSA120T00006481001.1